jgi:hypothetical protein
MKSGIVSRIKSMLVPDGRQVRVVPLGLYRGLHLDIDLRSQTQIFLGLWERETYWAIRRAAARAQWFLDVGAGRGELCIFFAKLSRVKRIIAIDPSHAEVQGLLKNISSNDIASNRIDVLEKFVGTVNDDGYVRIDQLNIIPSARGFIKIDVDGFELDVLRSGRGLLSQGNVDLLIETHSRDLEKSCIEFLENLGYKCRVIKNAWWRLLIPEQRPIEHNRWFFAEQRM